MGARKDRPRITDDERAEILRLAREGLARNEVARQVGRDPSVVTRICNAAGVSFDRSATKAATAARQIDLKALRAELQIMYLQEAKASLLDMRTQYTVHAFVGGPDGGEYMERTLTLPPAGERRSLMQASTYAAKMQSEIWARDNDGDAVNGVTNMLRGLGEALGLTATHG